LLLSSGTFAFPFPILTQKNENISPPPSFFEKGTTCRTQIQQEKRKTYFQETFHFIANRIFIIFILIVHKDVAILPMVLYDCET